MKNASTVLALCLSFSAIAQAGWTYPPPLTKASLSLPPDVIGGGVGLSLPPDEQSPPIQAGDPLITMIPDDNETIRELLPRVASAEDIKVVAAKLTAAEKAALYRTAMVARALLVEAQKQ